MSDAVVDIVAAVSAVDIVVLLLSSRSGDHSRRHGLNTKTRHIFVRQQGGQKYQKRKKGRKHTTSIGDLSAHHIL